MQPDELACDFPRTRSNALCPTAVLRSGTGEGLDVQVVTLAGGGAAEVIDQQVAGYLAKYATKARETTGTLDRPVACWHCKGNGTDCSGTGPLQ